MKPNAMKLTKEEVSDISFALLTLNSLTNTFIHADMWYGEEMDRDDKKVPIMNIGHVYDLRNKLDDILAMTENIVDCDHPKMIHEHTNWYKCAVCGHVEAR